MKDLTIGILATLAIGVVGICDAQAANSIAFGPANKSCGGAVLCSKDGTNGYLNNGRGQPFKASAISRWFQIDADGKSHLKGEATEPLGPTGRFLVVNDTGRPISLFALMLETDFNAKTPEVHACADVGVGKLCNSFTADDGTNKFAAQVSGPGWDRCTRGNRLHNWKLCIGNPAAADFAGARVTYSWRAKATGAIPKGANFTIDFSKWNSNAWASPAQPLSVVMISADSTGNPGNAASTQAAAQVWTADSNNVVFTSKASNLPGSSGTTITQYVYDVPTAALTPISTAMPTGTSSSWSSISGSGGLVAYSAGETAGNDYLYNTSTQSTLALSYGDRSDQVFLSGDGTYFIINGIRDDLSTSQVWVYNTATQVATQMLAPGGAQPDNWGCNPIGTNLNGEYVLLICTSDNLVPGVTYPAIYVWDQFADTFSVLTRSTNGTLGMPAASQPDGALTPDGRYAVFPSPATDLVAGGTVGDQVFIEDQTTQAITLVSASSDGTDSNGDSVSSGGVSADGRYALFNTNAPNLGAATGCTVGPYPAYQVFLKDLQTGALECVSGSVGPNSWVGNISPSGEYVTFQNFATGQVYLATMF